MKKIILAAAMVAITAPAMASERFTAFGGFGGFATQGSVSGGSAFGGSAEAFQDTGAGVRWSGRSFEGFTTQQGGAISEGNAASRFQGSGLAGGVAGTFGARFRLPRQ